MFIARRLSRINSMNSGHGNEMSSLQCIFLLGRAVWVQEGNWQRYPYSWVGFGQIRKITKRVKE